MTLMKLILWALQPPTYISVIERLIKKGKCLKNEYSERYICTLKVTLIMIISKTINNNYPPTTTSLSCKVSFVFII